MSEFNDSSVHMAICDTTKFRLKGPLLCARLHKTIHLSLHSVPLILEAVSIPHLCIYKQ